MVFAHWSLQLQVLALHCACCACTLQCVLQAGNADLVVIWQSELELLWLRNLYVVMRVAGIGVPFVEVHALGCAKGKQLGEALDGLLIHGAFALASKSSSWCDAMTCI